MGCAATRSDYYRRRTGGQALGRSRARAAKRKAAGLFRAATLERTTERDEAYEPGGRLRVTVPSRFRPERFRAGFFADP
jgi:hypothetical protein